MKKAVILLMMGLAIAVVMQGCAASGTYGGEHVARCPQGWVWIEDAYRGRCITRDMYKRMGL